MIRLVVPAFSGTGPGDRAYHDAPFGVPHSGLRFLVFGSRAWSPAERRDQPEAEEQNNQPADRHPHDGGEPARIPGPGYNADDERNRRRQKYRQPAKGCERRVSSRMQQRHQDNHRRRHQRQANADAPAERSRWHESGRNRTLCFHAARFCSVLHFVKRFNSPQDAFVILHSSFR